MKLSVARATATAGLVLLLGASTTRSAQAAGLVALDQFDPAPAGDTFFGVASPYTRGNLVFRAVGLFDYADQPLRLEQPEKVGPPQETVVGRQAFVHLNASFTVQDRLLVSLLLPFVVMQNGDSPKVSGSTLTSTGSSQIGDIRLGARVRMVGDNEDPFQLGVGFNVYVPTAPDGSYAGDGATRFLPQLHLGGRFKAGVHFAWSATGGVMIRISQSPSTINYGFGFAADLWDSRLQIGPELYASTPIQSSTFTVSGMRLPAQVTTNAELLLGAKVRVYRDLIIGWAVGPGLTQAIGTPALRFVGSIGWAPGLARKVETPVDSDGDGIPDIIDACPYAAGPKSADRTKNGCPVLDDDEDGIPNSEDACPNEYGKPNKDPKKNGCPEPRKPQPPQP
jgi:hypothetical protein